MNRSSKFKILVVGDSGSGKSSLIRSFVKRPFEQYLSPTEGFQLSLLNFRRLDQEYEVQLWDSGTAYFQLNEYTRRAFFHNASAVFITYDLTNKESLKRIPMWLQEAQANECYLVYIFAMKKDLVPDPDLHQLYEFLEEHKLQYFMYSATEHHENKIIELFVKIDNDKSFISRSSLAKGMRYSHHSEGSVVDEHSRSSIPHLFHY